MDLCAWKMAKLKAHRSVFQVFGKPIPHPHQPEQLVIRLVLIRMYHHLELGVPSLRCGPNQKENYDQYIQIDLLNLTEVTRMATQGREFARGEE